MKTQPMKSSAATTQTTRLLLPWAASRTARLRAALRRVDPYEFTIVGGLLLVVLIATLRANLPLLTQATPTPAPVPSPIIAFRDRTIERRIYVEITATPAPLAPVDKIVDNAAVEPAEPVPAEVMWTAEPAQLQVRNGQSVQPTPAAAPAQQQAAPAVQVTRSLYDHLPTAVIAVTPPPPPGQVTVIPDPNKPLRFAPRNP